MSSISSASSIQFEIRTTTSEYKPNRFNQDDECPYTHSSFADLHTAHYGAKKPMHFHVALIEDIGKNSSLGDLTSLANWFIAKQTFTSPTSNLLCERVRILSIDVSGMVSQCKTSYNFESFQQTVREYIPQEEQITAPITDLLVDPSLADPENQILGRVWRPVMTCITNLVSASIFGNIFICLGDAALESAIPRGVDERLGKRDIAKLLAVTGLTFACTPPVGSSVLTLIGIRIAIQAIKEIGHVPRLRAAVRGMIQGLGGIDRPL